MRHDPFPLVLKEGEVAFAGDADGALRGGMHGLIAHDARWLRRWAWRWPDDLHQLRLDAPDASRVRQRLARIEGGGATLGRASPRGTLAVERTLRIVPDGLEERLVAWAAPASDARLACELRLEARVEDLFEVRGFAEPVPRQRALRRDGARLRIAETAPDGVVDALELTVVERPAGARIELAEERLTLALEVPAGERRELTLRVRLARTRSDDGDAGGPSGRPPARLAELAERPSPPLPDQGAWRAALMPDALRAALPGGVVRLARRAADDLRALLLPTPFGPYPAAGVPWYVAPFGRDALLTCLLAPRAGEAARATLRLLAALQGRRHDPSRAERPGKIPHEMRVGAVTRTGLSPHGPHYGTVDATPLWVMLLHRRWRAGETELARELAPALSAALEWMREAGRGDRDGLLRFDVGEGGYQVQSWKDAGDSLTHADGTQARGRVAVVEVQGYAEAAWRGAAEMLRAQGDAAAAAAAAVRGERIRDALARRFFLPDLGPSGCHALALDGQDRPLAVLSSDPGHLLWTGSLEPDAARAVADALLSPACWSGWGVRTLARGERRYAGVSYHTGSVWPHDTALFAAGLARYGLEPEARRVAKAVLELAAARPDLRAPELVAGDERDDGPPVAYPDACRLQAWDAAAVLAMAELLAGTTVDVGES